VWIWPAGTAQRHVVGPTRWAGDTGWTFTAVAMQQREFAQAERVWTLQLAARGRAGGNGPRPTRWTCADRIYGTCRDRSCRRMGGRAWGRASADGRRWRSVL